MQAHSSVWRHMFSCSYPWYPSSIIQRAQRIYNHTYIPCWTACRGIILKHWFIILFSHWNLIISFPSSFEFLYRLYISLTCWSLDATALNFTGSSALFEPKHGILSQCIEVYIGGFCYDSLLIFIKTFNFSFRSKPLWHDALDVIRKIKTMKRYVAFQMV